MAHRISGEFDEAGAIESLVEKYGIEEGKDMSGVKRAAENDADDSTAKKPKKNLACVCEENRGVAEAIMEMAGFYFKNGDARKGG